MRLGIALCSTCLAAALLVSCGSEVSLGPADATQGTAVLIAALTATPSTVPPGATALIECKATSATGSPLTYQWQGSGNVGYLSPEDSICIFSSPGCHSGPATVTVTVTDGSGASASKSVKLN